MPLTTDYDDDSVRNLIGCRVHVNESNRKSRPLNAAGLYEQFSQEVAPHLSANSIEKRLDIAEAPIRRIDADRAVLIGQCSGRAISD